MEVSHFQVGHTVDLIHNNSIIVNNLEFNS